jgi:hypothetical protein
MPTVLSPEGLETSRSSSKPSSSSCAAHPSSVPSSRTLSGVPLRATTSSNTEITCRGKGGGKGRLVRVRVWEGMEGEREGGRESGRQG